MAFENLADDRKKRNRTVIIRTGKLVTFWYRTIRDFFQARGMFPVDMDRLNSLVRDGAILGTVYFSILVDIPSGPLAFVMSRAASISHTSDSEQSKSLMGQEVETAGLVFTIFNCFITFANHCLSTWQSAAKLIIVT